MKHSGGIDHQRAIMDTLLVQMHFSARMSKPADNDGTDEPFLFISW